MIKLKYFFILKNKRNYTSKPVWSFRSSNRVLNDASRLARQSATTELRRNLATRRKNAETPGTREQLTLLFGYHRRERTHTLCAPPCSPFWVTRAPSELTASRRHRSAAATLHETCTLVNLTSHRIYRQIPRTFNFWFSIFLFKKTQLK